MGWIHTPPPPVPQQHIDKLKFINYMYIVAKNKGVAAAMNGAMNDGGQTALENEIEAYVAGMNGQIPKCWDNIRKNYMRETNDEFAEYQRLKEKFE